MDTPQFLFFIHLPVKGHIGCLQLLAILNNDTQRISGRFLCREKSSHQLGKYLGVQFLEYIVRLFSFVRNFQTIFQVAVPFHIPPVMQVNESFCCCPSLPTFDVVIF